MTARRRAVITGFGVVAANGIGLKDFQETILQGRSGVGPITLFDASQYKTRIAGEVKGFDPARYIRHSPIKTKRMARQTQLALAAADLAFADARLNGDHPPHPERTPVILGVSSSGIDVIEGVAQRLEERGPDRVGPYGVGFSQPHAVASTITETLSFRVLTQTISTACQAGLDAIAQAANLIRIGKADMAIAGGADAPITPLTCASFCCSGLLSCRNDEPEKASRPFDRDRDGGIVAEGAGVVIIEELRHALARGVVPYMEITGYGSGVDERDADDATGLEHSMTTAIANAGKRPEHIQYICAHGPSDRVIDRIETAMIKKVFGPRAYRIPVSSIKGVTANPLAAAGPFELAATAIAFQRNCVPPTANYDNPDPECDLDYVPNEPRAASVSCALVNVHGLGGSNGSMVVERVVSP